MNQITVKYAIGESVTHFTGVRGMVTAIFIRDKHTAYELAFADENGLPKVVAVEECELTNNENGSLGFRKKLEPGQ
jgi:hypothetical protein